jgi:hypothetical protein
MAKTRKIRPMSERKAQWAKDRNAATTVFYGKAADGTEFALMTIEDTPILWAKEAASYTRMVNNRTQEYSLAK